MTADQAYEISQKGEKFCQDKVDMVLDHIRQAAKTGKTELTVSTKLRWWRQWPFYETHEIVRRLKSLGYNVHCYHSVANELKIFWGKS